MSLKKNYKPIEGKTLIGDIPNITDVNKAQDIYNYEYLNDKKVPRATEIEFGGIKASLKQEDDTVEARIDPETGKLFVKESITEIPIATSTIVGGITASTKTDQEIIEVKIDPATGKLYVPSGDSEITVRVSQASEFTLGGIYARSRTTEETSEVKIDPETGRLYAGSIGGVVQATDTILGGIKANPKGEDDVVEVKIDPETGRLYTAPSSSAIPTAGDNLFDKVIRTQNEFETLLASNDWLGANSVAFIGNGGTLKFIANKEITIPDTVKNIAGFGRPIIKLADFSSDAVIISYWKFPTTNAYSIEGICVECNATHKYLYGGFRNCINIKNCELHITATPSQVCGFAYCKNIINCILNITSPGSSRIMAFNECQSIIDTVTTIETFGAPVWLDHIYNHCDYLINCKTNLTYHISQSGGRSIYTDCNNINNCNVTVVCKDTMLDMRIYSSCTKIQGCEDEIIFEKSITGSSTIYSGCDQIDNCSAKLTSMSTGMINIYGWCTQLNNCDSVVNYSTADVKVYTYCIQVSNCTGLANSSEQVEGFLFYNCSHLSNCKIKEGEYPGIDPDNTATIWGGTNLFRDDDSCQLE